jgi:VCBS repeat-containing protein
VPWTYTVANSATQYLAAGQTASEVFTVTISDGNGGTVTQNVTVTATGTNDAPVINAITTTALNEQTNTAALTTSIPVTFTDVDLIDTGHTASITNVVASGITTGLALDYQAALSAWATPGTVTKASGSSSGSINMGFSAPATALDYLAAGEVLTLTYTVGLNDGDGGTTSQTFVVNITGR